MQAREAHRRHGQHAGIRRRGDLARAQRQITIVVSDGLTHDGVGGADDLVQARGVVGGHLVHGGYAHEAVLGSVHHHAQRFGLAVAEDDAVAFGKRSQTVELRVVLAAR